MTERRPRPGKVRVSDKRLRVEQPKDEETQAHDAPESAAAEARADHPSGSQTVEEEHDYLDDLKRLQAEFDNYRKRMMREQTEIAGRAGARVIERLLPVLDNFERALAHSDDDGIMLLHKDLISVLGGEGLRAIDAEGQAFDPNLHEAVESHEAEDVEEPTVVKVYRTGYELNGKVLRPAMVVVARPVESTSTDSESEGVVGSEGE
jgi:molecular chaperone GrpE